ncbi:uncharacterized protein LOC132197268 isoform X2 [Neocloeon triangulifer]|uniref:uncharacterized protein LOC132197268 isoform X2 n=1 Tax=Neocloeon triangulifer TaxID=2078957 RepID=UPI00286EF57A|nr:uncharacterized protein LOC132197268 isoform X2 [Neocloeon triangulifer]
METMATFDAFQSLKSSKEVDEKIASLGLREQRFRVKPMPSLRELGIRFIFKNANIFSREPVNYLGKLPYNLAQDLLALCVSAKGPYDEDEEYEIKKAEREKTVSLVKRLLNVPNSNIKSLDILGMLHVGEDNCYNFVQLALKNCPKLEYVSAPCPLLPSACANKTLQLAQSIVTKWSKLRSLDLMGFFITDAAMKLISEKLPDLQRINLCLCKDKFTMAGADFLIKLKKLTDLELSVQKYDLHMQFFANLLIKIPGNHPSLQRIHLNYFEDSPFIVTDFVDFFGKYFPEKELTLDQVFVIEPLRRLWSPNLQVNSVILSPSAYATDIGFRSLCAMPCGVSELVLFHLADPELLYKLLEKLGPQLKKLWLLDRITSNISSQNSCTLNLFRVMSLCPALEHFSTNCLMPLQAEPKYNLTPQHFANMKSFQLDGECKFMGTRSVQTFFEIFEMVMKGSKCLYVLDLQNKLLLLMTAKFLKTNPNCLPQVKVFNAVYNETGSNIEEIIATIGKQLMLCSPFLSMIEIHGLSEDMLPIWFLDMAANLGVQIKARIHYNCSGFSHVFLNRIHVFSSSSLVGTSVEAENRKIWLAKYYRALLQV